MVIATRPPVLLYLRQNIVIGKTYQTQKMYRFKRLDRLGEKTHYIPTPRQHDSKQADTVTAKQTLKNKVEKSC